ncbi:MAG: hypothetical protein WCQ77_10825 [Planctomycetota bacterium]
MSGVEWNLIGETAGDTQIEQELKAAFDELWQQATPLDTDVVARYATRAKQAAELRGDWDSEGFSVAGPAAPLVAFAPRPWQQAALDSLAAIRRDGSSKALVAEATLRTAPDLKPGVIHGGRSLAGVERVWWAISAGNFYPAMSVMNCLDCGYRDACRACAGS